MTEIAKDIYLVDAVLSKTECQELIDRSETLGFEPSELCTSCVPTRSGIRNNDRVEFEDETLAKTLWNRCKANLPKIFHNNDIKGLHENFRFYRYEPGQSFKPHTDNPIESHPQYTSRYTCLFYLNDDFDQGETVFYNERFFSGERRADHTVPPRQGTCLIFKHDLWHEGRTPDQNPKYVLRTDILYKGDQDVRL
ncbi:2OG-Fe(II) oxygenase [Pseudobacteriovorax antillogorgiicola]|uniref:2OG-Fe(II) oxygenase superfamily protein n=1 Tax=Pseudobacteriovorax antillogorgiicola TaxID=1513793 RepID=A0A1Y6B9E5_9BACT|nr:2OG-Fe(II) oxygenase [Pseudobacteriovorax antillogorgiicola]TCS57547.1 2-oxoglutarate-Fe(II)-dependent oxygenase superfamily protein [Pseudobacteriovorax antillogorgiicola]SME99843.1 2OG-Fe(II) oxygenase superfamily protein [Pseudobacteriovorax antillogorgiicola]